MAGSKTVFVSNKCQYSQLRMHALSHVRISLQNSQTATTILFRTKIAVFCIKHPTGPSLFTLIEAFGIKQMNVTFMKIKTQAFWYVRPCSLVEI
jgi:hypothetical protein